MSAGIDLINTEEIIFYIDLVKDYINQDTLIKEIEDFIELKSSYSSSSTYGIVIFQEEENPVYLYDMTDSEPIIRVLREKWENRPKNQSFIENGLFEILSYVFKKSRQVKKVYRIIVISDTPSRRSDEYHQAVYDLIIKSKKFSTIVDIIRVGESEYYEDEVKIKVITSETHGGVFFCNNSQFEDVFSSLVKCKQEFNIVRGEQEGSKILEEDKTFYERLAVDLITLDPEDEEICSICELEVCPVCGAYSDEIHKCYNCNAKYHGCCASRYSIIKNIGFKHIFRCPSCETLLKLDEDYVDLVYEEDLEEGRELELAQEFKTEQKFVEAPELGAAKEFETEKEFVEAPELEAAKEFETELELEVTEELEIDQEPVVELEKESSIEEEIVEIKKPPPPPPKKKIKIGGYFGREIDIGVNSTSEVDIGVNSTSEVNIGVNSTSEVNEAKIIEPTKNEEPRSITALRPPRKRVSIIICTICGTPVKHKIICTNCGARID